MRGCSKLLLEAGWKMGMAPMYFLGFDISWLVMKEVFVSPYDHKPYSFSQAMRQETQRHPWLFAALA
ncbi:MAG: hypothetical protein ACO1OQ_15425 [Rufibacter sp.]